MDKKQKSPLLLESKQGFKVEKIINEDDGISSSAQLQRLLAWLREKPITTIQARGALNILAPAARIWELRHKEGHNIVTHWVNDVTIEGKKHRVAQYVLLSGKFLMLLQVGKAQPAWRPNAN